MSGGPLSGTEGIGEAAQAFDRAMDSETPSRSRHDEERRAKPASMPMEDLFPRRNMDRREKEGGADTDPEIVQQARAEARGNRQFGEDDASSPRDPIEGNDDGEEYPDDELPDVDGDEDVPEDTEEQEAAQGDLDLDQIVEVNIDGQASQVSLKEALSGYIRTETFHRRLGDLSQGVQALQTQRNEMETYQSAFVERAQALEDYVQAFMPKEPDWDALYRADPGQAALHERRWRTFMEQVEGLKGKREATQKELEAAQSRNLHNFATANRAQLAQSHPEWRNEKVWTRDHESMRRTARTAGYSDAELNQLYDARGVEVLLKAAKYDRLMASKPKPVRNGFAPASKRNGATPSRNVTRALDKAEKRLSRTGSLNDAASAFERMLDRER